MLYRIDPERTRREMVRRGMTQRALAAAAGIPEMTLSRAMTGGQLQERTFRKVAEALARIPVVAGADLLLPEPAPRARRAARSAAEGGR